ncbi:MAG: NAD(P)H-hydrate epimerase [Emergencia sp.]
MESLHKKQTVTCAEMKALEAAADAAGLSYYQMMENAGSEAARIIADRWNRRGGSFSTSGASISAAGQRKCRAVIFCGKGNNGGDGFVAARKLKETGMDVTVVLVEGRPVTADALTNFRLIEDKIPACNPENMPELTAEDLIIDAVYGTGFHGALRSPADQVIGAINRASRQGAFVAALDLPSGLSGDMTAEEEAGVCVRADLTVTFHAEKPVHRNPAARAMCGETVTADIGIGKALERPGEDGAERRNS